MLLIYDCDRPEPDDPRFAGALERMNAFTEQCRRSGVFVAGDPLQAPSAASMVRVRDGETLVTDGPYAETHEQLGGYYTLDCADLDEALAWAARCPLAEIGSIEVRPIAGVSGLQPAATARDAGAGDL
jgi:hypothetical protein